MATAEGGGGGETKKIDKIINKKNSATPVTTHITTHISIKNKRI